MTVIARRRRSAPTPTPEHYDVIELFAGPGGASMGLHALGLRGLGIEWDESACNTRRAAGLPTIQSDVSILDPTTYLGVEGFWASPPCQGFSRAGLQKGHGDAGQIMAHIAMCLEENRWVDFDEDESWEDPRSHLVLEPLRWVFGMQPRWMVWEQVPFVQIIWDACKPVLEHLGYHVWTGKMYAEQYGVPQTRERAILIASLDGPVGQPAPTHSRYYSRTPAKLDPGVEKWVSMAEALGWGMEKRPYITVAGGTAAGGQDTLMAGGSGARKVVFDAHASGDWVEQPEDHPLRVQRSNYSHGSDGDTAEDRGRGVRLLGEPSLALTGRPPQWLDIHDREDDDPTVKRAVRRSRQVKGRVAENLPAEFNDGTETVEVDGEVFIKESMLSAGMGNTANQVPRDPRGAPAATITGKGSAYWVVSTGTNSATIGPGDRRDGTDWRAGTKPYERSVQAPAPTVDTKAPGAWAVHLPGERIAALRNNTSEKVGVRDIDTPAPTMYFGARLNSMHWLLAPTEPLYAEEVYELLLGILTEQVALVVPDVELATSNHARKSDRSIPRTGDKPAPTLMFGKDASAWRWREKTPDGYERVNDQTGTPWNEDWPFERPATVLATRDLVQHPGANANRFNGATKSRNDGLRVSVQEAGVLQSFPADYPWQGTRTKQFEAVGNAVPPLLASHAAMEAARPTRGTGWAPERKKS